MKVKANPRHPFFLAELRRAATPFSKWSGIVFRAAPLEFSRLAKLLDGKGGWKMGGRWLAPQTFLSMNFSTTPETALNESSANFGCYNCGLGDVSPRVAVGVRLHLTRAIDLTNPRGVRSQPWFSLDDLLAEDWRKINDAGGESLSQAFGRAARDAGAEAIMVPSARVPNGVNTVYFPAKTLTPAGLKILGAKELARWLKKR